MRNSGFSGKGFKFDDTERELANEKKKLQKAALGLQDSDEEDAGMDVRQNVQFRCFSNLFFQGCDFIVFNQKSVYLTPNPRLKLNF